MEKKGPDHYRLRDEIGPFGVKIHCDRYVVIGETERCYYVLLDRWLGYSTEFIKKHRKRVLKDSYRRHCYPDLSDALRSYKARKSRQIRHARLALARAEAAHAEALRLTEADVLTHDSFPHRCAGGEYIKGMNWSEY